MGDRVMPEPLFPIKPPCSPPGAAIHVIEPFRHNEAWVFDEPRVGLHKEPFVAGITEMIDRLVAGIPDAANGFRLLFAASAFEGHQAVLTWVRADPVEGNWYRASDSGEEGWLCPALFWFFTELPARIYVRAEPRPTAWETPAEEKTERPR
jgi:hypothetical protein